jgi:hypothetical protein
MTFWQPIGNREDYHPYVAAIDSSNPPIKKSQRPQGSRGCPLLPLLGVLPARVGGSQLGGWAWRSLQWLGRHQAALNLQKCHQEKVVAFLSL